MVLATETGNPGAKKPRGARSGEQDDLNWEIGDLLMSSRSLSREILSSGEKTKLRPRFGTCQSIDNWNRGVDGIPWVQYIEQEIDLDGYI